ncbi:hypothetical protein RHMOL_Rhmol07G0240800 [Rhododendron molle]|uniref:Uncharacterized protein n=1 Tax=Rhododendron molle TaxID=49168 RepID=A0ACC0N5M0_RHOML|nr:hypothetical protein RHMOL_Rhmol07G0240800 [Rhododendron molle]
MRICLLYETTLSRRVVAIGTDMTAADGEFKTAVAQPLPKQPGAAIRAGFVSLGTKTYVLRGDDPKQVYVSDLNTDENPELQWEEGPSLKGAKPNPVVFIVNEKIYALAGSSSWDREQANMVLRVPFRRWLHVRHRNPGIPHGGFYCLLPIESRRVIAAVTRYPRPGHLEYKAFSLFGREYRDILGLDENLEWAVRDDLVKWLDALVHNSFMRYSTPDGLLSSFEGIGRTTWILIKHGCKAWPIQVVNAVMQRGWHEFRTAHALTTNYKLILACERRWIFNAIILDQNDVEVSYDWTMLLNEHWRTFHSSEGNFVTACLPSTIHRNLSLLKSGYWCIPHTNYLREFQTRLQPVLEDLNLEVISVRMGNRTWSISAHDAQLNAAMFNIFFDALGIQLYDYVLIILLPNLDVRVVILDSPNDRERIYDWF